MGIRRHRRALARRRQSSLPKTPPSPLPPRPYRSPRNHGLPAPHRDLRPSDLPVLPQRLAETFHSLLPLARAGFIPRLFARMDPDFSSLKKPPFGSRSFSGFWVAQRF